MMVTIAAGLSLPAHALTRQEALRLAGEVIGPSSSNALLSAWMTPAPLPTAGRLTEIDGNGPQVDLGALANASWFVFVDPEPCAMLEHDVTWLLIDDVTGAVTAHAASNLPAIDGNAILEGDPVAGRFIFIYSAIPRPEAKTPNSTGAPSGDYGDAPDELPAYPSVTGKFPTLYGSANAFPGRTGCVIFAPDGDTLGNSVTVEFDALDPADPDGRPNLVDSDSDERVLLAWDPNTVPATGHLICDVTLSSSHPTDQRYLNVCLDLDANGKWENAAAAEWVVPNFAVPVTGTGSTETIITPAFAWGASLDPEGPVLSWLRVLLTREELVPAGLFGAAGWDGSGSFQHGEVEDFKFYRHWCPGEGCPPPPGSPPDEPPPEDPPPPDEPTGWDLLPIRHFALVVQGVDNPGQSAAKEAADNMERLLRAQGYATSRLQGNRGGDKGANETNIRAWLEAVKKKVRCQDHVLIYFIAHGKKGTPGGSMKLRHARSGDDGRMTGDDLDKLLDIIPPCPNERCDIMGKCCDVTVIVESCYAGQFLDELPDTGRNIIASSEGDTPSYFGKGGVGGAYSDAYIDCARPANAGTVDGGGGQPVDGNINPAELHAWASSSIGSPYGRRQAPQGSNMSCKCTCPPRCPDCVCDAFGGLLFFPSQWYFGTDLIGESFGEFPLGFEVLPLGRPQYRNIIGDPEGNAPDRWEFQVQIPIDEFGRHMNLQVLVNNIPPSTFVHVPMFLIDSFVLPPSASPVNMILQVDVAGNFYYLSGEVDRNPTPELFGDWHQFERDLREDFFFFPIPAYRNNRVGQPQGPPLVVERVDPGEGANNGPFHHLLWQAIPGTLGIVQRADSPAGPWSDLTGPLERPSLIVPQDQADPAEFWRVIQLSPLELVAPSAADL